MRMESCRKCGETLEVNKKCSVCKKENEFFCHKCGFITVEQIHSQCMLIEYRSELLEIPIQKMK